MSGGDASDWIHSSSQARTDSAATLLYAEPLQICARQLEAQREQLESMRSKVITLLSFVGAATGFMVGATLTSRAKLTPSPGFLPWAFAATMVSLLAIIAAICVLMSVQWKTPFRARWEFDFPIGKTMAWIETPERTLSDLQRLMIIQYRRMLADNARYLRPVQNTYTAFVFLAALQIILWVVVIWQFG